MVDDLSINLATIREQCGFAEAVDLCLKHGITSIAPWRDQIAKIGLDEVCASSAKTASRSPAFAVAASFRQPLRRIASRRSTTISAPSMRQPLWAPIASCLWSAGSPAIEEYR